MMSSLVSSSAHAGSHLALPSSSSSGSSSGSTSGRPTSSSQEQQQSLMMLNQAQGSGHALHSVEKILDLAQISGDLRLVCRNLKTFPANPPGKFDLKDTIHADLSRNKLNELPSECTEFSSMEKLILYHNVIRSIPDSIVGLNSLHFLDLSRNQLTYLPSSLCHLPNLQVLIIHNNRLVSLPEELGKLSTLMELDASCNEITHLPVQIGDLQSLKNLNLRRNHLQEVPLEISFIQLIQLDLSANRITALPVELRFMTSVVKLSLGENPLTCPPANLCSRGKVHVFKYLEIQAIKEDRKRGVLSEVDYKRSYRKNNPNTSQLNDLKFANGFNSDARRKRHTADSGYGSEQPLDRRWSQELSQDVMDKHTEDARRIVLRAANAKVFPSKSAQNQNPLPPPPPPKSSPPESSASSSTSCSSGYSSIIPNPTTTPSMNETTRDGPSSASARPSGLTGLEHDFQKMMDGMFSPDTRNKSGIDEVNTSSSSVLHHSQSQPNTRNLLHKTREPQNASSASLSSKANNTGIPGASGIPGSGSPRGESPDDEEKELRRRAAQKVLGKQGSPKKNFSSPQKEQQQQQPPPPIKPKVSQLPSPRHNQPLPVPAQAQSSKPLPAVHVNNGNNNNNSQMAAVHVNNSNNISQLPVPKVNNNNNINGQQQQQQQSSHQTYRQFKEHLRQQRHSETTYQKLQSQINGHQRLTSTNGTNEMTTHQSSSTTSRRLHGKSTTRTTTTTVLQQEKQQQEEQQLQQYDVKTMQKEAVLSYVKSRQHASSTTSISTSHHQKQQQQQQSHVVLNNSSNGNSTNPSRSSSTSSIPQPTMISSNHSSSHHNFSNGNNSRTINTYGISRREMEKSATAEVHINQLRVSIENRLRITLPDELSSSLQDGVVLCHIANHVRPRAVPTIHVPSPAVPKLNIAKCKRNVENFLLACRKIGVREDLICSPSDILEPRQQGSIRISITVSELLRFAKNISHKA